MDMQARNKAATRDNVFGSTGQGCSDKELRRIKMAVSSLMATVEVGLPMGAMSIAIERDDPVDGDVLARLKADFKARAGRFIEEQVRYCVCLIQTDTDNALIRDFQERRRALIRGFRDKGVETIWCRALNLVQKVPGAALAIYDEGGDRSGNCVASDIQALVGKYKGAERLFAAIKTRADALEKDLAELSDTPDDLDERGADLVAYYAAKQFGGARVLLVSVVAQAILAAIGFFIALLITDDPKAYKRMVELHTESGEFDELDTAIAQASTLPLWGNLQQLVDVLGRSAFEDWPTIAHALIEENGMATGLRTEFERIAKENRQQRVKAEKETAALMKQLKSVERELAEAKKRMPQASAVAPAAAKPSIAAQDGELAELRKANARLQQRIDEQGAVLANTRALLDSLINQPAPAQKDSPPMTEKDFRELKGVVVGGHINMISKLRKVMPNCLYYSADHRKVDEAAARDRDFMIFFTSHCNHCLGDNALRLSRLYEIPTGYSGHVNVDMFLKDVAKIIGREVV